MPKWEYRTINLPSFSSPAYGERSMAPGERAQEILNDLGSDGWEAVCTILDGKLLLKRPKDEGFGMPVIPEPHEPKPPGPN